METKVKTTFTEIRKKLQDLGKVHGRCREVDPYYYSHNGGTKRERRLGEVGWWVWRIAKDQGIDVTDLKFPRVSWSGKWRRTLSSLTGESQGTFNFWYLADQIDWGMVK